MTNKTKRLRDLKGLGEKSEQWLNQIGIFSRDDLEKIGPAQALLKLESEGVIKANLNMLYAMVGALEDKHWTKIAQKEKGRLLLEIEGFRELKALLKDT